MSFSISVRYETGHGFFCAYQSAEEAFSALAAFSRSDLTARERYTRAMKGVWAGSVNLPGNPVDGYELPVPGVGDTVSVSSDADDSEPRSLRQRSLLLTRQT